MVIFLRRVLLLLLQLGLGDLIVLLDVAKAGLEALVEFISILVD